MHFARRWGVGSSWSEHLKRAVNVDDVLVVTKLKIYIERLYITISKLFARLHVQVDCFVANCPFLDYLPT